MAFVRRQKLNVDICGSIKSEEVAEMFKKDRYKFYPECQDPCENMEVSTFFLFKSDGYHGLRFTFMREAVIEIHYIFLIDHQFRNVPVTDESLKVSFDILLGEVGGFVGMILG